LGVDTRALAAFRIAIGALLVADLLLRSRDLVAFYTDFGVLPRTALLETLWNSGWLSIHMATGSAPLEALFFLAAGGVALALMAGFHTTLATAVSWFFLIGLQARNPMVGQGGDILLRLLLFWGMFLPLGARYSVDAALSSTDQRPRTTTSFATVAYVVQLCFIYAFAYVLKTGPEWTENFSAVYYALNLEQFTTPIGDWLRQLRFLHRPLTVITLALEGIGWLLILVPFYRDVLRVVAVVLFAGMHLGFAVSMHLGLFSYIAVAAWIPLLPSWIWDRAEARWSGGDPNLRLDCRGTAAAKVGELVRTFAMVRGAALQRVPADEPPDDLEWTWRVDPPGGEERTDARALAAFVRASRPFGFVGALVDRPPIRWVVDALATRLRSPEQPTTRTVDRLLPRRDISPRLPLLAQFAAGAALLIAFAWNLQTVRATWFAPEPVQRAAVYLRLDQRWDMFAPYPSKDDGWYVVPGQLRDGTTVDVFRSKRSVDWSKPSDVSDTFRNQRWRKYLVNLWRASYSNQRKYFGGYLCRKWNEAHDRGETLESLDIYYMRETTPPPGETPDVEKVKLWSHHCFENPSRKKGPTDLSVFDTLMDDDSNDSAPNGDVLDALQNVPRLPGGSTDGD
ncbi:MAG: HTTM domain-containing protein, partial [Bradymonadaceae bacterium]